MIGTCIGSVVHVREISAAGPEAVAAADFLEWDPEHVATWLSTQLTIGRRLAGWRVVGRWHSHPSGNPVPSLTDAESADRFLEVFGLAWMVEAVAVPGGQVAWYLRSDGRYRPLEVLAP